MGPYAFAIWKVYGFGFGFWTNWPRTNYPLTLQGKNRHKYNQSITDNMRQQRNTSVQICISELEAKKPTVTDIQTY